MILFSGCGDTKKSVSSGTDGKSSTTGTTTMTSKTESTETKSISKTAESAPVISKIASTNPYFNFTTKDPYGNRSINVFGDSITHGANSIDIPNFSYIGLFKKAITAETGSTNYGFTSIEGTMWNAAGTHKEIHQVVFDTKIWKERRSGMNLGTYTIYSKVAGAVVDISVRRAFKKFCIYYATGGTSGVFEVVSGGKTIATVNGYAETPGFARTEYINYDDVVANKFSIRVGAEGKTVSITGVGYYDDINDVVVNNYSNNGLMLQTMSESVISFMCKADTVIFALGYNDSHFSGSPEEFTKKINIVIKGIKESKAKLIVNDLCWNLPNDNYYRTELKRLSDECGGIYIDYAAVYGDTILSEIKDTAHPTATGHKLIADELMKRLNLK